MAQKYRSVLVTAALLIGSLVVISTISSVLDVVMRRKAPVVVDTYTPPNSPVNARPAAAGSRSQLRDRLAPAQTILMPGTPDSA